MNTDTDRDAMLETWITRARKQKEATSNLKLGPNPPPAHVGLWLDRCYFEPTSNGINGQHQGQRSGDKPGRYALYESAIKALQIREPTPPAVANYRPFFERWKQWATCGEPGIVRCTRSVQATSRLLLHPAAGSTVTEGGLLLHHTYGVPYIPGSALKGLARRRAQARRSELSDEQRVALFGFERDESVRAIGAPPSEHDDEAGTISFLDALWIPEAPSDGGVDFSPLALDLVNPHHSAYYTRGESRPFPLESDEPVPTLLLSVRPGTRFLLVIEAFEFAGGLGQDWLNWVCDKLLLPALNEEGIGARTSAGYGRLRSDRGDGKASLATTEPVRHVGRATVVYQAGNGELKAHFADRGVATVRSLKAQAIIATLSEGVRAKLKKGKPVLLSASWEAVGNARSLVGLREE